MNWNRVSFNDCNKCGANDWKRVLEKERDDPSEVEILVIECKECEKEGRLFAGDGYITQTGALRE